MGSCPGWGFVLVVVGELSWWGVVLVGTCLGGELYRVEIFFSGRGLA